MIIVQLILMCLARCQLQINPIQGQPFYYNLEWEFNTNGYDLQIMSPSLGLSIQGGFTQGPLNTNINVNSFIRTSLLEEYDIIAILKQIGQLFYVELVQYDYQGIIGTPITLFNITSVNQVCQDIEILEDLLIIVHCINTTNNQIKLYNYNDTIITTQYFNISLTNYTQVISVDIESYYNMEQYDLYFVYITKLSSFIYYTTLSNNTYSVPQLVWTYNASFLQIFISNDQEIFALQFNYLLYQYQGQQTNYSSQNKSNWISMTIQYDYQDDFLIYLVNNYTITELFFLDQFYLIDEQLLPIEINSAQMFSTYDNIYVLTPSYALIYRFEDNEDLTFSQFSKNNLINTNNLISSQQNILISFSSIGVQIYQLLDYALFSLNPQNSGQLLINFYNLNGLIVYNSTLYINLLSNYQNQIMPTYNYSYGTGIIPSNANFIYYNVGQYYVGSNISYYLNQQNFTGISEFTKSINNQSDTVDCDYAQISSLNKFNSYLFLCAKNDAIKVTIGQQLQFDSSYDYQLQQTTQFQTNYFAFIGLDNQTDIFLAFSYQSIYVYQVQIDIDFTFQYSIDLSKILGVTSFIVQGYVIIDTNIFLQLNQSYVVLGIYLTYYKLIDFGNQTFTQVSGIKYDQNYLFITSSDMLEVYVWYDYELQLYQQYAYKNIGQSISQLFVYPLIDGLFILVVSNTTQLYYSDKSVLKMINLGQTPLIPIDTTNFTLNYSLTAYSSVYFYIHAIQNDMNYINIYQCNQQQIGSLKQSKWVSVIPQNITVSSDLILQIDYISVYLGEGYSIFSLYYYDSIFQFPDFQLNPEYSYINDIILNNSYSQASFLFTVNIIQYYMHIVSNFIIQPINGNLSNGSFTINPYLYFSGAIQGYNISCNQCQSIEYKPIISDQYLYYDAQTSQSVSYLQNNIYQLYLANDFWINYSQVSNTTNYVTQPLNVSTIAYYSEDDVSPVGIFLEVNTNAITWIVQNGSQYYICTILPGTNQTINITIPGLENTNTKSILYNNGYLQIIYQYNYSCYFYQIVNSSQLLTVIVSPTSIQQQISSIFSPLSIASTPQFQVFGSLSQTMTNTIFSFIINVTQIGNNSFALNSFNIQYLQQFDYLQQFFFIQSIFQFGEVTQQDGIYVLVLAYTTSINSGIVKLEIKDQQVLNLNEKCTLQLFNQKNTNTQNILGVYQNQISILQTSAEKDVNNIILNIYHVDIQYCNFEQIIQPYTYKVFDNQQAHQQSIQYLNQNNLMISINGVTQIYEINNFINLQFNTSQDSSILITAYNNLYNQSQLINIYYTSSKGDNKLAWYWILLITLVCLIIIILVGWYFFYRNRSQEPASYQQYKEENEIEIKTAKNENLTQL